jgi:hypothetical protein
MHHKKLFIGIASVLAACVFVILLVAEPTLAPSETMLDGRVRTQDQISPADQVLSVKNFVRRNISALSPKPEVLGGTFYVVDVAIVGEGGTVQYEDGHNAYVADFTYSISPNNDVIIETFVIRS